MIKAEILADSVNSLSGDRITTLKVVFPRMVLAELNTHRMLSKNSASSRAIPFKKMVKMVEENPFIPIAWQKEHKGMQGTEYFTEEEIKKCGIVEQWLGARDFAVHRAKALNDLGVTKQLVNRTLEPFMYHTVILTGTEFENFFKLRCPQYHYEPENLYFRSRKDWQKKFVECFGDEAPEMSDLDFLKINKSAAEIHISRLAECIWDAMNESTPKILRPGFWHIPYGDKIDIEKLAQDVTESGFINSGHNEFTKSKLKVATARLARISYETLGDDAKIDYAADVRLHDDLLRMEHMSPFEHCARAMNLEENHSYAIGRPLYGEVDHNKVVVDMTEQYRWCRNFRGFVQYREDVERSEFELDKIKV
jgi:hypothetical protein